MKLFNLFHHHQDIDEDANIDWRDLNALPKEIVSKEELDHLQNEVIAELEQLQTDTIKQMNEKSTAKPQTLFYYHKYIDSKFNKNDFDVDTYFTRKQNIIDQKYAEGLGEIRSNFTGYKELIDQIQEIDLRLRKKVNKLDPTSNLNLTTTGTYDDSAQLLAQINSLPDQIDWKTIKEESK